MSHQRSDRPAGDFPPPASSTPDNDELHDLPDLTSTPSRRNSQYVRMQRHGEGQGSSGNNQSFAPSSFSPYAPQQPQPYGPPYGPYGPYGYPQAAEVRRNTSVSSPSNQEDTTLAMSRSSSLDYAGPAFPVPNVNATPNPNNPNSNPNATTHAPEASQSQTPYYSQPGSAAPSMYSGSVGEDKSGHQFYEFEFEGGAKPGSNYNGSVKYPPSHAYSHAQSYSVDANAQAQVLAQQRATQLARRQSTSSRVSYDYFDPQGMSELVRKLSKMEKSTGSTGGKKGAGESIEERDRAAVVNIGSVRRSASLDSGSISDRSEKAGGLGASPGEKKAKMVLADASTSADPAASKKPSFDLEMVLRAAMEQ